MRIGLIITELHPGGAEKCFVNLAIYLRQQGHEVAVWELWPPPPADKRQQTDRLDEFRVPWKSGGALRPWHFLSTTGWLKRELKAFNPDVVQSFLFHANLAAAMASRRQKWRLFGGARVRQPERLRQRLQRWSARRMEKLICVSQSVKTHCQATERIENDKLTVICNGIPRSDGDGSRQAIDAATHGIPNDRPLLLFVGRLDAQKGIAPLFQHADALLAQLPQHHLAILGDGPLKSELLQHQSALLHRHRVHILGWQANATAWMKRCETLLLPARYEGMPNVILEAMSIGKPVVAFDVDGVREVLGDDSLADHQAIPAKDFAQFISAIHKLAADPVLRERCGSYNRQRIEEHFVLEQQLAKYEELYRQPGIRLK